MNDITAYLATLAVIAGAVWGAIHGLRNLSPLGDRAVALLVAALGVLCGCTAQGMGFIHSPATGMWAWIGAGLFGLLAAFAGAGATDFNLAKAAVAKAAP